MTDSSSLVASVIVSTFYISDHGDTRVTVNRLPVCYPDLLSHSCSNQLCGSIDNLIIFKQSHSEGGDQTKLSQKWLVIVPGKNIRRTEITTRKKIFIPSRFRQFEDHRLVSEQLSEILATLCKKKGEIEQPPVFAPST